MQIDIETLRKTKGIGEKTLERIKKQHYIDKGLKEFESTYIENTDYKIDKDINLWQGDCLELMSYIPDKSIDMILCDLPYGTTACSWDEIIPFEPLWSHYKRIIKDNGAIVLFGSEPFSTKLRMSNLEWYKYDWVWEKDNFSNPMMAKYQPLRVVENILIFSKNKAQYYPQGLKRINKMTRQGNKITEVVGGGQRPTEYFQEFTNYPRNIIKVNKERTSKHPTQKPIELLEYLIKTYTNEDMLVLDNTMGSGSTGVACRNLNRKFIGIELDTEYFDIAKERILKEED